MRAHTIALTLALAACTGPATIAMRPDAGPPCMPTAETETMCSDGVDEDCDGYRDCLDSDCEGTTCGSGAPYMCIGGGCLRPGDALPMLPQIDNVRVTMRGSTAVVDFEPVDGARDYRIYPLPNPSDVLLDESGQLGGVRNAIYRCGGDRPFTRRADDPYGNYDASLTGAENISGFVRNPSDNVLGYVFLTPAAGRVPVYRVADPTQAGGYLNADWNVPTASEFNAAQYITDAAERDNLLAMGWRDDGIAFYITADASRPVYRVDYETWAGRGSGYFIDGAEADHFRDYDPAPTERFRVLDTQVQGSVPLYRVYYLSGGFDVLAPGNARYQRILEQGNQPIWSLTWSGLTVATTLVIEALDAGCPFPGGYVGPAHSDADTDNPFPTLTIDEARLGTGEVFVNGQHDPTNRPRPIARAYVDVTPEAPPAMTWYESFDGAMDPLTMDGGDSNNGVFLRRNSRLVTEYGGCTSNHALGPVLGQFFFGGGDGGSSCNMSIIPRGLDVSIDATNFLHLRMSTEIPSTGRRYPQLMITTVQVAEPGSMPHEYDVPVRSRLGPLPISDGYVPGSGTDQTIIVQPFQSNHELQIEFCDRRGWGVSVQCQRANIYGFHAGSYTDEWPGDDPRRTPAPPMGDLSGHDRQVQFDVYATTQRVYVYADGRPAGCAILPAGRFPVGRVTPLFGAVIYHGAIDESVVPADSPHQYMRIYQPDHYDRRIDELGVDENATLPGWDETTLPCGDRWFGGEP